MLAPNHWVRRSEELDPARDSHQINLPFHASSAEPGAAVS